MRIYRASQRGGVDNHDEHVSYSWHLTKTEAKKAHQDITEEIEGLKVSMNKWDIISFLYVATREESMQTMDDFN